MLVAYAALCFPVFILSGSPSISFSSDYTLCFYFYMCIFFESWNRLNTSYSCFSHCNSSIDVFPDVLSKISRELCGWCL